MANRAPDKPIVLSDLHRSKIACYRIEDAVLRSIAPLNVTSSGLLPALEAQRGNAPSWCEPAAWNRIVDSMLGWVAAFGNLNLWWNLRHKKDE